MTNIRAVFAADVLAMLIVEFARLAQIANVGGVSFIQF